MKYIQISLALLILSCVNQTVKNRDDLFLVASRHVSSSWTYHLVYSHLVDSIHTWAHNKLRNYEAERIYNYAIDSLLVFNSAADRFIAARHLYVNNVTSSSDDLQFLYGEKINGNWYFFKGPSIVIPRVMVKDHNIHTPLSYQQLHEIALKEIYGGYLKSNGEINEDWFRSHFEGIGWGDFSNQAGSDYFIKGKRFTDKRKFFEYIRLECVRNNWRNRDTSQAVIKLPQHGRP